MRHRTNSEAAIQAALAEWDAARAALDWEDPDMVDAAIYTLAAAEAALAALWARHRARRTPGGAA